MNELEGIQKTKYNSKTFDISEHSLWETKVTPTVQNQFQKI